MEGYELIKLLIEATGLPSDAVERELNRILAAKKLSPASLTLEDVRELMACYLQDVLVEAKDGLAG